MPDLLPLAVLFAVLPLGLSVLLYHAITGVPPVPSRAVEAADIVALLRRAGLPANAVIYELGSGWGSLVLALERAFPEARIRGIELSPVPYWTARLRTRRHANIRLDRADFFRSDLRDADAVVCYLLRKPMPRLARRLDEMLKPGTPVVSLSFWFRDRTVAASRRSGGVMSQAALYYWPARKAGAA